MGSLRTLAFHSSCSIPEAAEPPNNVTVWISGTKHHFWNDKRNPVSKSNKDKVDVATKETCYQMYHINWVGRENRLSPLELYYTTWKLTPICPNLNLNLNGLKIKLKIQFLINTSHTSWQQIILQSHNINQNIRVLAWKQIYKTME